MIGLEGRASRPWMTHLFTVSLITASLFVVLGSSTSAAQEEKPHLRSNDHGLTTLIEQGKAGSATFRALMVELDTTPVMVYADCEWFSPSGVSARASLMAGSGTWRYVRIRLDCRKSLRTQLAMLAHELQHALEIAETPAVVDEASMEGLYREIGFETCSHDRLLCFETEAAVRVQRQVAQEMLEGATARGFD